MYAVLYIVSNNFLNSTHVTYATRTISVVKFHNTLCIDLEKIGGMLFLLSIHHLNRDITFLIASSHFLTSARSLVPVNLKGWCIPKSQKIGYNWILAIIKFFLDVPSIKTCIGSTLTNLLTLTRAPFFSLNISLYKFLNRQH